MRQPRAERPRRRPAQASSGLGKIDEAQRQGAVRRGRVRIVHGESRKLRSKGRPVVSRDRPRQRSEEAGAPDLDERPFGQRGERAQRHPAGHAMPNEDPCRSGEQRDEIVRGE